MRKLKQAEVWILQTLAKCPAFLPSSATDWLIVNGMVGYQDWHGHHHILDAGRDALAEHENKIGGGEEKS